MPLHPTPTGGWDVSVCVRRQRAHRRLPPGTTEGEAKRVEAELRIALGRGSGRIVVPGDPGLTEVLGLFVEHSKTLRSPGTALHHAARIAEWAAKYRASETRQAVAHILRDLRPAYKPATINRSLGTLKKGLHLAWDIGLTHTDYSSLVKFEPERNARTTWLSMEEVRRLTDHTSEPVRAAIWISVLTGCRRGEALAIRPDMIGRDTITLPAGATKTLRTRTIPIIAPLRPWLKHVGADGLGITFEGVKSGFRRAREAAGMEKVQFRDLRRSTGTLLIQAGVPLHHVSQILGHTSTQVTERVYAHLAGSQLKQSMQALARLHQRVHQKKKRRPKAPLSA